LNARIARWRSQSNTPDCGKHEERDMEWLAKLFEKYPEKGVYVTLGIGYLILLILCEYVATKIAH
jgi:hypothetical protein